jgi:hypothetical protein
MQNIIFKLNIRNYNSSKAAAVQNISLFLEIPNLCLQEERVASIISIPSPQSPECAKSRFIKLYSRSECRALWPELLNFVAFLSISHFYFSPLAAT